MDQTPLPERAGEARLHSADQAERAVGDDEQRIAQAAAFEVLEEARAAGRVLLRARREMKQDLLALLGDAPRTEDGLPRRRLESIILKALSL